MKQYNIAGIPLASFSSKQRAVEEVLSPFDQSVVPGFAIAINPEKVMKARTDKLLMETLLSATLRFADGVGVVWAMRSKGARDAVRIPGCELWEAVMREAGKWQQPVFIVGAKPDILDTVRYKLSAQYHVNIVGSQHGYFETNHEDNLIANIRDSEAKIVTVAMGSPKQELFIQKCRSLYPDAFYMGVGGTYDVYVGNVLRAPAWACRWNIEWLYRLAKQPHRIFRQLALLKFLLLMLTRRL